MGAIANVTELLNASDIFVLPTTNRGGHEEGCPVALLEAMAAGVPCIASNVAGSRDLIRSQQTGLLFKPENATELAECIRSYIDKPSEAKRFADNARKMVSKDHSLDKEASGFSNMYLQILKR
jgi:glycosyltransferase involved in cell wall biosynthesis